MPSTPPTFTLYRGWPTPSELVWSPFVTKVELRLRLASLPYTTASGSTSQSPKGKIPYITADYGTHTDTFSDSTLIINRLVRETHLPDLNAQLSPNQQLTDFAIRALLEDKLYFYHMHERWVTNYYAQRDQVLGHMAVPLRAIVGLMIYRSTTATLHGQGTGRFSPEEFEANRREIWETIERQLEDSRRRSKSGSEPFWVLGGSQATEADATLFGFVSSVLVAKSCPASQELVRTLPAVMDYANRIMRKYFAECKQWD